MPAGCDYAGEDEMITREYMVCGRCFKSNGSSSRAVWAHVVRKEWRQDVGEMIKAFKDWCDVQDDEVFVLYSVSRLPRWL